MFDECFQSLTFYALAMHWKHFILAKIVFFLLTAVLVAIFSILEVHYGYAPNCPSASSSNSEEEEDFFAEFRENTRKRKRSEDEPAHLVEAFLESPTTRHVSPRGVRTYFQGGGPKPPPGYLFVIKALPWKARGGPIGPPLAYFFINYFIYFYQLW